MNLCLTLLCGLIILYVTVIPTNRIMYIVWMREKQADIQYVQKPVHKYTCMCVM